MDYKKHLTYFTGLAIGLLTLLLALFLSPAVPCSAGTASVTWRVTQYGDDHAGKQSMFYTIKGSNGKLIVVDGQIRRPLSVRPSKVWAAKLICGSSLTRIRIMPVLLSKSFLLQEISRFEK